MDLQGTQTEISTNELVQLCALDNELFAKTFFPGASRQESPPMHRQVDELLDDPRARLVNLLMPRDFAKTTKLRMFTGKRIAYGLSHTILYVAASETKASQNIQWLRNRIESKLGADGTTKAPLLSQVFSLRPGKKWTELELEIFHSNLEQPIWVLGVGITSDSIRGINFDDYRPDLIVLDDILTDENAKTKDARDKIADLVMGAVKNSLSPATESPNAKLVMLNTPQDVDDIATRAEKDQEWATLKLPCWTPDTLDAPPDEQMSAWEARHPSVTLRAEKNAAIAANRLSVFCREKEVRIITKENSLFRSTWLNFVEAADMPKFGEAVLSIDPVPPPDQQDVKKKNILKNDFEVHHVWRRHEGNFYLMESDAMRGHTPSWSVASVFRMARKWRVSRIIVEGVAYQKTLKWILEEEMKKRSQWFTVELFDAIKSKPVRINTLLHGPASNGRLYVQASDVSFIEQFTKYPNVEHDDELDCAAMAIGKLNNPYYEAGTDETGEVDNSNILPLKWKRNCP